MTIYETNRLSHPYNTSYMHTIRFIRIYRYCNVVICDSRTLFKIYQIDGEFIFECVSLMKKNTFRGAIDARKMMNIHTPCTKSNTHFISFISISSYILFNNLQHSLYAHNIGYKRCVATAIASTAAAVASIANIYQTMVNPKLREL